MLEYNIPLKKKKKTHSESKNQPTARLSYLHLLLSRHPRPTLSRSALHRCEDEDGQAYWEEERRDRYIRHSRASAASADERDNQSSAWLRAALGNQLRERGAKTREVRRARGTRKLVKWDGGVGGMGASRALERGGEEGWPRERARETQRGDSLSLHPAAAGDMVGGERERASREGYACGQRGNRASGEGDRERESGWPRRTSRPSARAAEKGAARKERDGQGARGGGGSIESRSARSRQCATCCRRGRVYRAQFVRARLYDSAIIYSFIPHNLAVEINNNSRYLHRLVWYCVVDICSVLYWCAGQGLWRFYQAPVGDVILSQSECVCASVCVIHTCAHHRKSLRTASVCVQRASGEKERERE